MTAVLGAAAPVTPDLQRRRPRASLRPRETRSISTRSPGCRRRPPGTVRVGLVATYGRWKGHATFLDAMRPRRSDVRRCRAYVIGGALYDTAGSQYTRAELEG